MINGLHRQQLCCVLYFVSFQVFKFYLVQTCFEFGFEQQFLLEIDVNADML